MVNSQLCAVVGESCMTIKIKGEMEEKPCQLTDHLLTALFLTLSYFTIASGTTFWTGPRMLYPIEALYIVTFLILINIYTNLIRNYID